MNIKKLLLPLLLLCSISLHAQEASYLDVTEDWLPSQKTELQIDSNNNSNESTNWNLSFQNELGKLNISNNSLDQSTVESMDALELLDNLDKQLMTLQLQVETLTSSSKNLETELLSTKEQLKNSITKCSQLKTALISNRDDTGTIAKELGEIVERVRGLEEKIEYYKKRLKRATIVENITIPLPGLSLMTVGIIEIANGNNSRGIKYIEAGAITLGVMEVVYQGGKWVFKLW